MTPSISNSEGHKSSLPISANAENYYQISAKGSIILSANAEAFYNIPSSQSIIISKNAEAIVRLDREGIK